MTALQLVKNHRSAQLAAVYILSLFCGLAALGYLSIHGGNPMTLKSEEVLGGNGSPSDVFRPGDIAGVRRQICSDKHVAVQSFPALTSAQGYRFPLPSSFVEVEAGCQSTTYGFVVPNLPSGVYKYDSVIRFQNNLVGRDESASYPTITLGIAP